MGRICWKKGKNKEARGLGGESRRRILDEGWRGERSKSRKGFLKHGEMEGFRGVEFEKHRGRWYQIEKQGSEKCDAENRKR